MVTNNLIFNRSFFKARSSFVEIIVCYEWHYGVIYFANSQYWLAIQKNCVYLWTYFVFIETPCVCRFSVSRPYTVFLFTINQINYNNVLRPKLHCHRFASKSIKVIKVVDRWVFMFVKRRVDSKTNKNHLYQTLRRHKNKTKNTSIKHFYENFDELGWKYLTV